jgi:hypothetical protein
MVIELVGLWHYLDSFLLLSIGTVISIQENPFPGPHEPSLDEQSAVLRIVRRNVMTIFRGVSKQHSASSDSASLVTIRVRPLSDVEPEQASIKQEDGPSLLLYYIFDDWISSYGLVARKEHQYGASMDRLVGVLHDSISSVTLIRG